MPAYRSAAEAEIRDAVVEKLREYRPGSRIIHEINVSSYGPNRIDLIAVDRAEIIAVEIKSAKDKLDRLPAQIAAMKGVAHHVIAAVHEKFLVEQETNEYAAHFERGGKFFRRDIPDEFRWKCDTWVFPRKSRAIKAGYDGLDKWESPPLQIQNPLPSSALDLLWRDELYDLCGILRIPLSKRPNMPLMQAALRWNCSGGDLTRGICTTLRARKCVEADPEIIEKIAA